MASQDGDRYIGVGSLMSYFGVMAIPEGAIQKSIESLMEAGLIEPYDLSKKDYSEDQKIAISFSGMAHLDIGMFNPVYFEQMALTTRIVDQEISAKIAAVYGSNKVANRRLEEVRELFCGYLVEEDARNCSVPESANFAAQQALLDDLRARWGSRNFTTQEMLNVPAIAAESAAAFVQQFDHKKGFGFVMLPDMHDTAFIHASTVEQGGFKPLYDGDEIQCEVSRTERGLAVSKILKVLTSSNRVYKGVIVKILRDRSYGFLYIKETGLDAFFHFNLISEERIATLAEGQEMLVEVKTGRDGRSQVRRVTEDQVGIQNAAS